MVRIRFSSPFSSKVVVCGHCLVTLSLTIMKHLKWLSSLPILMQESFWWGQCSRVYVISPPLLPYPLHPFYPSLINLMFLWTLSTMFTICVKKWQCGHSSRIVAELHAAAKTKLPASTMICHSRWQQAGASINMMQAADKNSIRFIRTTIPDA